MSGDELDRDRESGRTGSPGTTRTPGSLGDESQSPDRGTGSDRGESDLGSSRSGGSGIGEDNRSNR